MQFKKLLIIILFLFSQVRAQSPFLDSLKLVLANAKNDTVRSNILNILIQTEYDERIWPKYNDQMREIAEKNYKIGSPIKNKLDSFFVKAIANALDNEGYYEYYNRSNIDKAIQLFNRGLELDLLINNKAGIADAYNSLGMIAHSKGEITKALEFQFKALKVKEEANDKRGMAVVLDNIGATYAENGDDKSSLIYFNKALKIFHETGDKSGYANILTKLAHRYREMENFDSSLTFYKKALDIMEEVGDPVAIGGILLSIGNIYIHKSSKECGPKLDDCQKTNLNIAKGYFVKSMEQNSLARNKQGLCSVENRLALIEYKLGNLKEAKKLGLSSLEKSEELGFPILIAKASEVLYNIEKDLGNGSKALEYFEKYIMMRDSVKNTENSKKFLQKQFEYDYNQKKEIDKANNEKELAIAEERENKQKLVSVMVGIGLFLVLVFAVIIFNRLRITNKQKKIIEEKNHLIEEKQKEILDSIHYAKRIQETILAHKDFINDNLPSNFVYYKPKDIVSGDFYWATKKGDRFYLAVCDSTGHGVPGAFMSLLNIGFLNEAISEKNLHEPHEIFNYVRERLVNSISREGQKDGFDGVLLCIDNKSKKITYTAANIYPVVISKDGSTDLPSNRMPVGKGEIDKPFDLHTIELKPDETLYLYTDGFADQFGGPKGKKFKYKQLNELLKRIAGQNISEQSEILDKAFEEWRGRLEQVDDVCVIGIKI